MMFVFIWRPVITCFGKSEKILSHYQDIFWHSRGYIFEIMFETQM